MKKSGVRPVVCVNGFYADTKAEIDLVRKIAEQNGALAAVSQHWPKGGEGAIELAEAVIEACEEQNNFKFLYQLDTPLRKRIELIAKEVYGADGVVYIDGAEEKAKALVDVYVELQNILSDEQKKKLKEGCPHGCKKRGCDR